MASFPVDGRLRAGRSKLSTVDLPVSAVSAASQSSPLLFVDAWGAGVNDGSTDESTKVQNAVNAASAIGSSIGAKCRLQFTPGKTYVVSTVVPQSYVDILGYGAALKRNPSYSSNECLFEVSPGQGIGSAVTQFALRGLTYIGTGTEQTFQGLLFFQQSSFLTVEDCWLQNLAGVGIFIKDSQFCWVDRNKLFSVCRTVGGPNAVDFVSSNHGDTVPLKHLWARGNYIDGFQTQGISIAGDTGANRTDPVVNAHITDNTLVDAGQGSAAIGIEQGPSPANMWKFDISGNEITRTGSGSSEYGIAFFNSASPYSSDAMCMAKAAIRGNLINTSAVTGSAGILCEASRVAITGNQIDAATDDIVLANPGNQSSGPTITRIAVTGNVGHLGSGVMVRRLNGVDPTTVVTAGNSA